MTWACAGPARESTTIAVAAARRHLPIVMPISRLLTTRRGHVPVRLSGRYNAPTLSFQEAEMQRATVLPLFLVLAGAAACSQPYKVVDATGKTVGEVARWDDRVANYPLNAIIRYKVSGDDVALLVTPGAIRGLQDNGGSTALFTTNDCSGNDMFAMLSLPPLSKRYGMVLSSGNPSTVYYEPTAGWLFVTDPLPARVNPGATVFHSQWTDPGCMPYPAPGFTVSGPLGGYWMKRVEQLYAKYTRPFYFK
jgi:hypothetical protein